MRVKDSKREDPVPGVVTEWTTTWSTMDFIDGLDTEVPSSSQPERISDCCSSQRDKYVQHLRQHGFKDQLPDRGCSCNDSQTTPFVNGSGDAVDPCFTEEQSHDFKIEERTFLDGLVFTEEILSSDMRNSSLDGSGDVPPGAWMYRCPKNGDELDDTSSSHTDHFTGTFPLSSSSPSRTKYSLSEDVGVAGKCKVNSSAASNQSPVATENRKKPLRSHLSHNNRKETRTRVLPKEKLESSSNTENASPLIEEKDETWSDVLDFYYRHFFHSGGKASSGFRLPPRRVPRKKRRSDESVPELFWPSFSPFLRNVATIGMMIAVWMFAVASDAFVILKKIIQVLVGLATLMLAVLCVWFVEALRLLGQKWRKWRGKASFEASAPKAGPSLNNITLPTTGDEAVSRLLNCQDKDPYSILGVSRKASDEEIKKYYRRQAVLVHPDKNPTHGAEEAFKILAHAFELIGEPEKRLQYDNASLESEHMEAAWQDFEDLLSKLHAKMEEAANTIQCTNCGKRHHRIPTERPCYSARYCSTCKTHHAARNGDIWAESTYLGFKWHYYACMDSAIFDVTEWAACQSAMLKHLQSNSHSVQYRIISNKKPRPSKSNLSSEPEIEDFMNLFCGTGAGSPPPPPSEGTGSFKSNLKKNKKKKKR